MTQIVLNPNSPQYGSEEYYDLWYGKGNKSHSYFSRNRRDLDGAMKKAVTPWDPPSSPYNVYFDSAFSAEIESYVMRDSPLYSLLRKETFQRLGDSWKYFETDLSATQGVNAASTPFASGSTESGPTLIALEQFKPAYLVTPWKTSMMSDIESEWQPFPNNDVAWLKKYFSEIVPHDYDVMLTQDIDAVANDGSSNLKMESIERMISNATESSTTFCNVATDGDIYWGKSSALIDRDADTDNTFGGGAGSGISLPSTAAARTLSLDYIDDAFAASLEYAKPSDQYIMLTGARTLNELTELIDPKQRFVDGLMDIQMTMNGVSTRRGVGAGFSVASFISNGIQLPIFTDKNISGEGGRNLTTKVTDADIGNIFIINLNDIHIRVGMPPTYVSTPPDARLTGDAFYDRHWIMAGMQLIATNFRSHAAIKYLKKASR